MAFIEIRNLTVEYTRLDEDGREVPGTRAIDGISLDIEKGSFVSVIGMNGSGKTTLAKCLNGLIVPTAGDVTVDGMNTKDESRLWDIRSRVGMVFQNPDNQIVSSIVEDDVAFGPENLGIPPEEIRQRVDHALRTVGMYAHRLKGAHMLSGGQKQRVAIAGAIAMRPECIIFDEPTAMLDPKGREGVLRMIRRLNSEGITTIIITHYMSEAMQAKRLVVMQKGHILADGTPQELFSDNDLIERSGLGVPPIVEIRKKLGMPDTIMTVEELAEEIRRRADS
jgi:energy-coupling factor transporter ATPase